MELLRPLQTGTSEDRRITFRAEKALTVFLDGGFIKFQRDGRSHCIQVQNKAYLTFENLVCERVTMHDNGGYRDGYGYSGLVGISGSAGIELKGCVMDGRHRWMPCLWAFEAGKMPGVPDDVPGFVVTDSVLLNGWRALGYSSVRPCVIRNSALVRPMTGCVTELGANDKLILRNNIITSLILSKKTVPLWTQPHVFDSDYNCFVWDAENENRFIIGQTKGLAGWQAKSGQDTHSFEADPAMPLIPRMGYNDGDPAKHRDTPNADPLKVEDILLSPVSPCRGKGENGEDIGPRWERFVK
jgi:hypothetical protein